MVTLADELLLLAYNDDTGRNQAGFLDLGLAGAVLLDLTLAGRLDLRDKTVLVVDPRPVGHPLLDVTLQRITTDKPRRAKGWVDRLQRGLSRQVLDGLVAGGVLTHDTDRVLGFIPFNRYRPLDPTVEAGIRARLDRAVAMGTTDARTAALAGLVYALNMEKHAVPGRPRREVRKGLKAIADGSWAAEATAKAVAATQAAVMAAVTAAVAASSTAAASGGG